MSHFLSTPIAIAHRAFVSVLAIGAITLSSCASQSEPPSEGQYYDRAMRAVTYAEPQLVAFRHDLHRHPELAGNEKRTSSKVAEKLEALGYDVRKGVGGYGVVAVLKGEIDGPLVAFRADMDAVAGEALDPVPYASQIEGVHHICGHDVHTAVGIGLAEGFAAIQDTLPGSVMFIFQPAEEAGTGAEAMLADDVFGTEAPAAIFAVHTAPFDVGQLAVLPDGMMAGRLFIEVSLSGEGDLDAAASSIRSQLLAVGNVTPETMLSFQTEPFIFIDLFRQAPAKDRKASVTGFVMSAGLENRASVAAKLSKAATSTDFDNVNIKVSLTQALEGVNNDAELVVRASAAINKQAPELTVLPVPGVVPAFSEDFGSFQRSVPGVMYFLGVNNPSLGTVGFPHSPNYVADDGAILVGAKAMLAAMLEVMSTH